MHACMCNDVTARRSVVSQMPHARCLQHVVRVRNTGALTGSAPLLAFVSPPVGVAGVGGAPLRSLVGVDKVRLAPGEEATVHLAIRAEHLALVGKLGERTALAGKWRLRVGSNNDDGAQVLLVVGA